MADNGAQALEETAARIENAPAQDRKTDAGAAPGGDRDAIRSVFVARTAASSAASAGGFARMATADEGLAVRGAYRAHLSVTEAEAVAGDPAAGGDLLRKAYLARAVADAAVQTRPKPRPARRVKRSASPRRKAAGAKAKPRTTRNASSKPSKPKKRGTAGARTKPRAAAKRAAARPARRGKRRGR